MPAIMPAEAALLDEIQQLRARIAILEHERQIPKEIIEKAPVMISIVRAPDFVYELVNPAFQALAPGKEFLGRRFADVWAEIPEPLVGLPAGFDVKRTQSLGVQLISDLVAQLNGSLKYFNSEGAQFEAVFPAIGKSQRGAR